MKALLEWVIGQGTGISRHSNSCRNTRSQPSQAAPADGGWHCERVRLTSPSLFEEPDWLDCGSLPAGRWGAISDSNPKATLGYFAERLNEKRLAYFHIIEPRVKGVDTIEEGRSPVAAAFLRKIYQGTIIVAGGFDRAGAEAILQAGDADLVAFRRGVEKSRRSFVNTPVIVEAGV